MIIFAPNIEEEMNWTDIKDIGITTLDVVLEEGLTSSKAELIAQ